MIRELWSRLWCELAALVARAIKPKRTAADIMHPVSKLHLPKEPRP